MIKFLLVGPFDSLHYVSDNAIVNVACEVYHFIIEVEAIEVSSILLVEYEAADTIVGEFVNLDIGYHFERLLYIQRCVTVGFEEDFARHIVNECYDLERSMGNLADYFDYERFGRKLFLYDYQMGANNNVFRILCPLILPLSSKPFLRGRLLLFLYFYHNIWS